MRALVAALLVAAGVGQPAPPPGARVPPPSRGRLVTVDVTVTDARGRTLADLKPSDFELREGGTLLSLESVRRVRVDPASPVETPARIQSAADERLAAGQEEARLFAIFLDEYHVASGAETDRVRETLRRFVDRDVSPRDLIVVMKPLDSLLTIRLTRDREAVRRTIEGFEGRKGDYQPRNGYERDYIAATPARIDVARSQLALSAINALAVHLGSLTDRRKTLIVATETVGRTDRRRDQEYLPTLDTVIRSANRSNVSVYPFDPRAAAGQSPAADLRRLADETDGQEIEADAESGLRRMTADCERVLPAVIPHHASRRWTVPGAAGAREACRGDRAWSQGLLDRIARRGAARRPHREGRRAEGGDAAGTGTACQHVDTTVVRHRPRRERQDTGDVRVGAGRPRTRRPRPADRVEARIPGEVVRRDGAVRGTGGADRQHRGRRTIRNPRTHQLRRAARASAPSDVDSGCRIDRTGSGRA